MNEEKMGRTDLQHNVAFDQNIEMELILRARISGNMPGFNKNTRYWAGKNEFIGERSEYNALADTWLIIIIISFV